MRQYVTVVTTTDWNQPAWIQFPALPPAGFITSGKSTCVIPYLVSALSILSINGGYYGITVITVKSGFFFSLAFETIPGT